MGDLFLQPVLFIYNTVAFQNLGLAIVEIAVLSRVVFYPFARQQAHYSKKMAELTPHINAIKERHKNDQKALAAAQMELFKQHGVNPAGGCLPAIVQIVILIGLFGALSKILTMNLATHFLIWDMAQPDKYAVSGFPFPIPGVLVILASLTQFIQTKMMLVPPKPSGEGGMPKKPHFAEAPRGKEDKGFMSEFAEAQSSMVWMFPLMFLFLGTQWPSGLALYWTVSSILAIYQQYRIAGWGGMEQYIVKLKQLKFPK